MIAVRDVAASSLWYQRLLGCESAHGGREYERLNIGETLILQLHVWNDEHDHDPHANFEHPDRAVHGYGVLLWFATEVVDEVAAVEERARALQAHIVDPLHWNANGSQWEVWVRDPDDYVVVVAGPRSVAAPKR
jgi:catechol 2,3-dioxygenase-like lactoylglutathione lyase family enzyme